MTVACSAMTSARALRQHLSRPMALGLLTLAVACGAPNDHVPVDEATWRIDSLPLFELGDGDLDTSAVLGRAIAAFRADDSTIVVIDDGYSSLRYFDREGTLVDSVGGEGDGPGEFRYMGYGYRCGDTLVVADLDHRRLELIGPDHRSVRSEPMSAPTGSMFGLPYHMSCGPTGVWLANGWDTTSAGEPTRVRGLVPYWIQTPEGQIIAVGERPGSERLSSAGGSRPHPLGKEAVIAVGRDRAYIGTADSFAIEVIDFTGRTVGWINRPQAELRTTDVDIARYRLLDTLGKSSEDIAYALREWQTFTFPPTVPAYTALVVDRLDNLWVREFPRSADNVVRWSVFDPTGADIGTVDLPATLSVDDIGRDYLVGIDTRLVDGSQRVVMYRLRREAEAR